MTPRVAPMARPASFMPSMQQERVALHDQAVGERARVALVGVGDDVLLVGPVSAAVCHLMPAGKPAPP